MEEIRPLVALLRSVDRERVEAEFIQQRGWPSREFQWVETPPDVIEDLADDRRLCDEDDDMHSMAAPAEWMVGILDAMDDPGPSLLPFLEPGAFGFRGLGRSDSRWRFDLEHIAPGGDPPMRVRVGASVVDEDGESARTANPVQTTAFFGVK